VFLTKKDLKPIVSTVGSESVPGDQEVIQGLKVARPDSRSGVDIQIVQEVFFLVIVSVNDRGRVASLIESERFRTIVLHDVEHLHESAGALRCQRLQSGGSVHRVISV
jgi:hypothetical protein